MQKSHTVRLKTKRDETLTLDGKVFQLLEILQVSCRVRLITHYVYRLPPNCSNSTMEEIYHNLTERSRWNCDSGALLKYDDSHARVEAAIGLHESQIEISAGGSC